MLPSHIGQYRILRKIGAGGMGLVYLGEHTLLGRRAAIKTLLPTVAANREIVERFFNEARATSAISDPGVIQVFDFGYHVDGTAYIVMELLEGEALSARLDRLGKLALGDALRFGRQIASSLAAAHARDIIHRDLKPENIFLVRDNEAQGGERTKIIDFGICKVGAGDPMLTEVGAMIGTPVYMSPEQCRGSGEVDRRSDVYAFGCLLFHLITGRPPFSGEASGDLIVAHLQEPAPLASQFLPGLPEPVDALLARCLAKAPGDRFASMDELGVALGELAAQAESFGPVVTPPPPTVPLGRGFRSVFDANLAAAVGGSRFGATPRLRFSPPPDAPRLEIIDDDDDLDDLELVAPRRRRAIRAALACVLVVGVTLGLVLTPLVLGDDDRSPPASRTAALPVEAPPSPAAVPAPAPIPPARSDSTSASHEPDAVAAPAEAPKPPGDEHADAPGGAAADPAAVAETASAPTPTPDEDAPRGTPQAADDAAHGASPATDDAPPGTSQVTADAPRTRVHAKEPRAKLASVSRASRPGRPSQAKVSAPQRPAAQAAGPVRSPSQTGAEPVSSPEQAASLAATPPAAPSRTPAMPVLTPMAPSPSPAPPPPPPASRSSSPAAAPPQRPAADRTPPAPSPAEDLYDTR